jgi:hypothetical protein
MQKTGQSAGLRMVFCKVDTCTDHYGAIRYCLQPHKEATIVEANIMGDHIDNAIRSQQPVTGERLTALVRELKRPFDQLTKLNTRVQNTIAHIKIGFDPKDGEVPRDIKAEVSYRLIDRLGYGLSAYLTVAHKRDKDHKHDHTHLIVSTIGYNGRHVHDSHNYTKAAKALRQAEKDLGLTPFISKIEKELQAETKEPEVIPTIKSSEAVPLIYIHTHNHNHEQHRRKTPERMGR